MDFNDDDFNQITNLPNSKPKLVLMFSDNYVKQRTISAAMESVCIVTPETFEAPIYVDGKIGIVDKEEDVRNLLFKIETKSLHSFDDEWDGTGANEHFGKLLKTENKRKRKWNRNN